MADGNGHEWTALDAARIEEAGLNAMQTPRQLFYDGWLLRVSPGKAKRARSVNAHFGSTLPLPAKIAHCEDLYARHGLPLLFRITPFVKPPELDDVLGARGYVASEDTLVLAAALDVLPEVPAVPAGVVLIEPEALAFADIVGELRGSSATERAAHRERLRESPLARRFVALRAGHRIQCAAQITLEDDLAGVFDVVTGEEARGRGYASFACAELLAWARRQGARTAYLQVDAINAPALAIYRKLGFATIYHYHYRGRPEERR